MKFLLATKNEHKIREMNRILEPLGIRVIGEKDCGVALPEVEETGTTFAENARLKAMSACRASGLPSIADDSGLCIDGLNGAPGVYSARFAGDGHDDKANIDKVLRLLSALPPGDPGRKGRFVCSICCCFPDGRELTETGVCEGRIATECHGDNGFGYDPIFLCGDTSFAEMDGERKDAVSHRGKALRAFARALQEWMGDTHVDR